MKNELEESVRHLIFRQSCQSGKDVMSDEAAAEEFAFLPDDTSDYRNIRYLGFLL